EGGLRHAVRGGLRTRDGLFRMHPRDEADRRPYLRGRHRQHELLGVEHRRVRRVRLGPARDHPGDARRDEAHPRRHHLRPLHQGLDAGEQGQPDLVQGDARQARPAPRRADRRQAPRHDAMDQAARTGGQEPELTRLAALSSDRPAVAELLARARAVADAARERAAETEAARCVGEDIIAKMRQADLFRILQPKAFGGFEYGFDVFAQVEATLASGCGSTGWVYGLLASHQWLIACFSKDAQDEVWQDCTALAAGSYAPVAQAEAVDGGYVGTRSGGFCSGCGNAPGQFPGGMIPPPPRSPRPPLVPPRTSQIT